MAKILPEVWVPIYSLSTTIEARFVKTTLSWYFQKWVRYI